MKKVLLTLCLALCTNALLFAQNALPPNGPVGIGTTSPAAPLHVVADNTGAPVKLTGSSDVGLELRSTGNNVQFIDFAPNSTSNSGIGTPDFGGRISYNLAAPNGFGFWTNGNINRLVIDGSGNIGIGTIAPNSLLSLGNSINHSKFSIWESGYYQWGFGMQTQQLEQYMADDNISNHISWGSLSHDGNHTFTELMRINLSGNLLLGATTDNGYKLSVNGGVHAKSVNVDMTGWSDNVFAPSYHLRPLSELKTYVKQNHHLPEVPSEQQVLKDGVNLGEMNRLLLKKVEELTLYMVEKDKKEKEQENINHKQQKQIKFLMQYIKYKTMSRSTF